MPVTQAHSWTNLANKPTTVSGFGITDMASQTVANATNATAVPWNGVSGKPTTIQGFGITDNINQGVSVASTSGSAIDFTSLPAWVKRITVLFNGVSMTGTNWLTMQLGTSGGIATSGYVGGATVKITDGTATDRFVLNSTSVGTDTRQGMAVLHHMGGNLWAFSCVIAWNGGSSTGGGVVQLGAALTTVRILPYGADTFDAGSINIQYE